MRRKKTTRTIGTEAGGLNVTMADGTARELPLRWINDREKTGDFTGFMRCDRCDTWTDEDGHMHGQYGLLICDVIEPDSGVWRSQAYACSCVYGALQHREQQIGGFHKPTVPFADKAALPRLTQKHWTLLRIYHKAGDTYAQAFERIPAEYVGEEFAGAVKAYKPKRREDHESIDPSRNADRNDWSEHCMPVERAERSEPEPVRSIIDDIFAPRDD